jgi:hypothetical protein
LPAINTGKNITIMESFHEKIANPFNFVDYQADILPSITAKFHLNEKNQIINN